MGMTSLDIINNLYVNNDKIINMQDFNSEKLSLIKNNNNEIHVYYDHNPFFLSISGLKGYFEEHDGERDVVFGPKTTKYLTKIFTNEYQKFIYNEILKKINRNINRNYIKIKFESNDNVPLNILVNIRSLVLAVRYQRFYINTCWYDQFYERIQVRDAVK